MTGPQIRRLGSEDKVPIQLRRPCGHWNCFSRALYVVQIESQGCSWPEGRCRKHAAEYVREHGLRREERAGL